MSNMGNTGCASDDFAPYFYRSHDKQDRFVIVDELYVSYR